MNMKKLSTEPYKGTRDFYPEDMRVQKYLFDTMRTVVERYGYEEYTASILEESDLYRAKSGEEIVSEQTYTFTDRGGRDVTLRPEMTPTVARMVANKRRELSVPVRWYSIPNCFRYERPQRGRLREFWQLNVDMLGVDSVYGDIEMIQMLYDIMIAFGADPNTFIIRVNNRALMNDLFNRILQLNEEQSYRLSKLIDKKQKMPVETFESEVTSVVGDEALLLLAFLNAQTLDDLPLEVRSTPGTDAITTVVNYMEGRGITNCLFDPTLMRGFDYYTGIVFEVFDTNPVNSRSLFGGGRYDDLVNLFGVEPIAATGFGMGDVTLRDYLETYNLLPKLDSQIQLTICTLDESCTGAAFELASDLRAAGVSVAIDYTNRAIGRKIKQAEQSGSQYVICLGADEITAGGYTLKKLADFSEETLTHTALVEKLSTL